MATHPRLHLEESAFKEIARRAARGGLHSTGTGTWQSNQWAQYLLLLTVAGLMLDRTPQSAEACEKVDIGELISDEMRQVIEALHDILPGGIMEIISYLPEEKRKKGWGRNVNW